ncbi:conjugal transfer mating-pair stabilization protein TraG [Cronobacter sakazakii]|uniref:conjugal transfer mating-pair stabilization protein TraG n=2 Tax=Cronobacter sakazakii TaxID=28141 RepID=UPI001312DA24|nr:conjugal transfer mating-pair stabilization protein TraG [Cronobacter sakazakii]ELY2676449.1 conjugal transfer mating pair stabilization protein TraG [Cronobacter sakazakii]ELY2751433.1 conjugal transfer mating pair stabilization protein TraG [Cronobacter sakazakii]ELY5800496.1 conjugal transfer mating pair stabilization protein TraG [Cronobacter sakazakii]EMD7609503.1 conjugal transfer mating pair stabilization protein TraG [Cronobacter sakazakii]KAB0813930.1 conjugal transfer mating pair 
MLEVYTIYGGDMWRQAFNAVVTILGTSTWHTLLRIAGTFSVLAVLASFIKGRNPLVFIQWLAIFMLLTSVLLVPKRSVQIIDITDRAAVYEVDNVPVGLAAIASLSTGIGFSMAQMYDYVMARPDSVTYTKSGMLFGSQIVAETSDFRTQNPELAQMLPDYVENCVVGDILLNHKYTVHELLNSTDPLGLITSQPSPLRGIYKTSSSTREFLTCQQAATEIRTLANTDAQPGSNTFTWLAQKVFGNRINGTTLLANAMGESYGYFYAGGMSASQIMKNNITNAAIKQGVKGFAARSSDTANLLNLATESSATKQRLSWAAGNVLATRTLPFAQSLLMLILVCLFPLVIALAAANHSLFGLTTLKLYICGFLYFQMWPVMFAILNFASTFWLQTRTGGTPLVLSNSDQVALQHSDVANLAGYLSLSIPVLSFYLTKGAASVGSQVAGNVFSSMAFGSAGQASTTADGNWSFNNMSMDNVSQNKMDTNLMQRQGQQTWQADNGSTHTVTAGGQNVIDSAGAMSNLPVNMRLSQLASSGFQEQARQSDVQARTALDGYNHSVTSGWSQLSQLSHQTGSSDSLSSGSDNSQTLNATRGASMMMSAAESYAKANNISTQEAYNQLMTKSQEGSFNYGGSAKFNSGDQAMGKIGKWVTGASVEGHIGGEYKGASGKSHGTQDTNSAGTDFRHDQNSQAVHDFKQGMDMVTSSRVTDSANHTDNAATSNVQQFAATLNDAQSQYHQYTTSSTRSDEFSRMATMAQNQSASLDTNYNQEFVNWASDKYGDKAQEILTSAPSAREAAVEFVEERLKPEIMGDYRQGRADLQGGSDHNAFGPGSAAGSIDAITRTDSSAGSVSGSGGVSAVSSSEGSYTGSGNSPGSMAASVTQNAGHAVSRAASAESEGTVSSVHHGHTTELQHSIRAGESHEAGAATRSGRATESSANSHSGAAGSTGQTVTGSGGTLTRDGEVNVRGGNSAGQQDMLSDYQRNQDALRTQAEKGFGGDNPIAKQVAEQRSANEKNINESAEGINKKQSTVQVSSDRIKGELDNASSKFHNERKLEEVNQKLLPGLLHRDEQKNIENKLEELRKKTG